MPFSTIDEYLAGLPEDQRAALESLRGVIRSADPSATETIGYQLPGFKHGKRPLVYFGAAKAHCALYGMSAVMEAFAPELKEFSTSKGTIRFQTDKPIPGDLVRRMVEARIAEIEKR